jgi:SAM-dependent methyltransferase
LTENQDLMQTLETWDTAAWCLAALALATTGEEETALTAAAAQVLVAVGLIEKPGRLPHGVDASAAPLIGHQAAAPLHKTSALIRTGRADWSAQSDDSLLAQGRASAQGARAFAEFGLPHLGDLAVRLAAPGARMLDVGTGVGALAVSYAEAFPALHVLGIDVMDRVLDLARQTIASSAVPDRVAVRKQDVAELTDDAGFDLAWIPAPFVPEPALRRGMSRIAATLRPGGWVMMAHGKYGLDPVSDAVTRFQTVAYGGTALDDTAARELLTDNGLTSVMTAPTPPGTPGITLGCAPAGT